jgi:beta-galactosidase
MWWNKLTTHPGYGLLTVLLLFCSPIYSQRHVVELKDGWRFVRGDCPGAEQPGYDDSSWATVSVPHDYAIAGPFSRDNDLQDVRNTQNMETKVNRKTGRTGGLPYYGRAWYRKRFKIRGRGHAFLYFDGAMSEATVFVNGHRAAFQPNGYSAFGIDITPYVRKGRDNVVAVHLDSKAHSSRWYPGAGLFREVRLTETSDIWFPLWGTQVVPKIDGQHATVTVSTLICASRPQRCELISELRDASGRTVASARSRVRVENDTPCTQVLEVLRPDLWSPERPSLYTLVQLIRQKGEVIDRVEQQTGLRTVEFRPQEGFFLNGSRRQIQGVCVHHDLGMLGTAVREPAIRHRLRMLKDMGCDAIRTSHNLPSSLLLRLCDEMGLMLMIEPFDEWDTPKCENGFHRFFENWADRVTRDMVRHFRNHPSVVLWGIGNEVPNQRDSLGWQLVNRLQRICHEEDSTRSVTVCMDQIPYVLKNGFARGVDVPGINYNTRNYAEAFSVWPQQVILGSETASTVSSRGVYKFPLSLRKMAMYDDHQSSGYDVECCSWSNTPDVDFALAEDHSWYAGQFVWTGFDYLGEPTPYNNDSWPSHSSLFGIIDLANIPKDRYYLYRSQWNKREHTLHILPHWTWPGREGRVTPVMVYTDFPEAELFLNGVSMGRRYKYTKEEASAAKDDSLALLRRYRLIWENVKYAPGTVKVIAYDADGRVAMTDSVQTAGEPCRLVLTADRDTLTGRDDMAFIRVSAVDKDGNLCPDYNERVHFSVSGNGRYVAAANGDPTDLNVFHGTSMPAFHGRLSVTVAAPEGSGTMQLTAVADDGCKGTVNIHTTEHTTTQKSWK